MYLQSPRQLFPYDLTVPTLLFSSHWENKLLGFDWLSSNWQEEAGRSDITRFGDETGSFVSIWNVSVSKGSWWYKTGIMTISIYRAINGGLRAVIIPAWIKHFQFGKLRVISIYPRARMALREVFLRVFRFPPCSNTNLWFDSWFSLISIQNSQIVLELAQLTLK